MESDFLEFGYAHVTDLDKCFLYHTAQEDYSLNRFGLWIYDILFAGGL